MFADSHAHLTCDPVYENIDQILERAQKEKVDTIINITVDKSSLERALALTTSLARSSHKFEPFHLHPSGHLSDLTHHQCLVDIASSRSPSASQKSGQTDCSPPPQLCEKCGLVALYHTGSTTPHDVEADGERHFALFEKAAKEQKLVAIGETGLDYYYEHSDRDAQKTYFIKYLELAKECDLPVVIHCRKAFHDFFRIVDEYYNRESVLLHCFTGNVEEAKEAIARGFTISFSGILTFKRSTELREIAKLVPLEKTLIETDTPYLAPQSKRGKPNEPSFLPETAECLATLHETTIEEIAQITRANTYRFFHL